MGAACQKQFQNIPDQLPDQYQIQKQRLSINSIKLQHKNFRPNSKSISIGMIDTVLLNQNSQMNTKTNLNMNDGLFKSKSMNFSKSSMAASKMNQNLKVTTIAGKQFDRQQLHATMRPFQGNETINLGSNQDMIPKDFKKNRQALDFNFYHSLALPQYDYRDYPPQVKNQFQNLYVCEQEDRNGVKYIGQWKDNRTVHGNGVLQSNTTKYIGQFKNGLKHFHGRQIEKQEVYQGQFFDGRRKGRGIKYTPQSIEQGQFDEYLINGKINYTNGNKYQGQLLKNKYHGKGIFTNNNTNTTQQGQFKNGKLNGKGRIKVNNNLVYEGDFYEDMKHGKGTYYWKDKQYYQGQYCKDKKHGQGILHKDDKIYSGSFVNGQLHGPIQINQKNNRGEQIKKIYNYNNGMRIYQDDQQSSIMSDSYGMPIEWQDIVVRKKQQDSLTRYQDNSSSYKIPLFKFPSNSNQSSFNFSKNQSDGNDISSIKRSQNIMKQYQMSKKPLFPSVIDQQPRLSSDSRILPPSINNAQNNRHITQPNPYRIPQNRSKFYDQDLIHSQVKPYQLNKSNKSIQQETPGRPGSPDRNFFDIQNANSYNLRDQNRSNISKKSYDYVNRTNQINLGLS